MNKLNIYFFVIYFFSGLFFLGGYGVSWDEPVSRLNGVVNLKYLSEQLDISVEDQELLAAPNLYDWKDKDYGVAFELPLVAIEKVLGLSDSFDIYHLRHFFNFLVYFLSVICLYKILIDRFKLELFSVVCVAFYILSPRFFAESFYNSKDIIFLASVIITHYFYLKFFNSWRWRDLLLLSIVTGMMIDVRIIGIIFPFYYAFLLLYSERIRGLKFVFVYAVLTISTVILFFPYLWLDPVGNFLNVIANMSNFRWRGYVLFDGQYIKSYELPWFYVLQWMLITLPVAFVVGIVVGVGVSLKNLLKFNLPSVEFLRFEGFALYVISLTLILIWVKNPIIYDGWRQFYFLMFPLFILMAVGFNFFYRYSMDRRWFGLMLWPFVFIHLVYFGHWIYKNHPHQNNYFNFIPGPNLTSKYELDYWGVGNMQALKQVLAIDDGAITISSVSLMQLSNALLKLKLEDRLRVKIVHPNDGPKYLITNYRYQHDRSDEKYALYFSVLFRIEVDGTSVITVYRRK